MRRLRRRPVADSADVVKDVRKGTLLDRLGLDPEPSPRLGRYVALGVLGRGGMGTVLKAYDEELDRAVAIKLLHGEAAERQAARLKREARALAKLSHANVVQVYEVGETEGQAFIAMELVQGRSLREWLSQEPRPSWRECVQVYLQAGEGLAAAHARGLVHRDFKPANAVIDEAGRVRVLDFGLARRAGDAVDATTSERNVDDPVLEQSLTQPGTVMGTPAYMAPEQMKGLEADARSDQFGFCVALYEALYGMRPFEGSSMEELAASVCNGQVRSEPPATEVPAALRAIVLRGLAADPGDRWPAMDALLGELRRWVSPRRRGRLVLAMAGGLMAMGLGIAQYAEVGFRCEGARSHLEGVWDEQLRQEVKDAILGTKLPYAADTWARVEPRLDEYAAAWAARHTEVCEATSVRQEQSEEVMDLRMECLRGRRVVLREAVKVLAQADETRVEHAVELVAGLPGLSRCDEVESLAAELPPPEDPDVAAKVRALREQLAQVRTFEVLGLYDRALALAEEVVGQAESTSHPPLQAEALYWRGRAYEALARYAEAEQDHEQAYLLAVEHRHDEIAWKTLGQLTVILGVHHARHEAGLQWGKTALALAKKLRAEPEVEAFALGPIGDVLMSQGKYEEALTHKQRALDILEAALGPRHYNVANAHRVVGSVLLHQGKLEAALVHLRRSLSIYEETLGRRHPHVAFALDGIGEVLFHKGEPDEALAHFQRSLVIREETLGPRHPNLAYALNGIGATLSMQGRQEESLTYMQRALSIEEEASGPRHPKVAIGLTNLGNVLLRQGRLEEALAHCQRAASLLEELLGPRHEKLGYPLSCISDVYFVQGEMEKALTHRQRVLVIWEEALGARHPAVAKATAAIGDVLDRQGKHDEAIVHYQRALAIWEEALGANHPDVGNTLAALAKSELANRLPDAARVHAERAVAILESAASVDAILAQARFVLARALWPDRPQRSRARKLAEQARDGYSELDQHHQEDLAEVEQWLAKHRVP